MRRSLESTHLSLDTLAVSLPQITQSGHLLESQFGILERRLVVRACYIWILLRTLAGVASAFGGGSPIKLDSRASILVVALGVFLAWHETRRQPEDILLGNLGTSVRAAILLIATTVAAVEILFSLVVNA